jgi:hypothetical protein
MKTEFIGKLSAEIGVVSHAHEWNLRRYINFCHFASLLEASISSSNTIPRKLVYITRKF